MPACHGDDASAKIDSECSTATTTSFTPAQIAAAEAALSGRGVEEAAHAPRLLAHMGVYAAGLRTPLFAKGTQTTLAVVFERCGQRMERVLGALVEHAGADVNARYALWDEECVKPLTPLEYVVGYWQSSRLRDLCRLFAFDALLKLGADAGAVMEVVGGARRVSLPAFVLMQLPGGERREAPRHLVRELLHRGARFRQGDEVNWVEAAARGGEAVLRVLLADAEASGEPDDERVLDAADVRVPREVYLDNGEAVVQQNLLEWLVFEGEIGASPRRLARYMRMLIEDYGFALPADAGLLATRAGVREALGLLAPAPIAAREADAGDDVRSRSEV